LSPITRTDDADRVVLTNGAQHGLACVLAAIAQPGDLILADNVTYQGINALCRALDLDIGGVAMDRGGMQPDAFDRARRDRRPRAVFLVPTFHNPTTITLSADRRAALIEIARRHNVLIIEDGVYAMLSEDTIPSFAATAPDMTIHVSGLSKCAAPGLRLGFITAPPSLLCNIATALRVNCWSINPLVALLGTSLIEDGSLRELVQKQKAELRARQAIVNKCLRGFDVRTSSTCTHLWLALPHLWRTTTFVPVARRLGVAVLAADTFAIGRAPAPNAVRINISAARSREDLTRALDILVDALNSGHRYMPDQM
jgi:DNA-binding transcriptional MocR family regulator